MTQPKGKWVSLSAGRAFMGDLMHLSKSVPLVAIERPLDVSALMNARRLSPLRPSWVSMFMKAYAIVAAKQPIMRRAYMSLPWPHLYEHPQNIASVSIERKVGDEPIVVFTHLRGPENQPLQDLDAHLRRCKEEPIESIGLFRRTLGVSRFPWFVRRALWAYGYHTSGHRRARYFGTFGLSVTSGMGCETLHLLAPVASTIHHGIVQADGSVLVRMVFDHRVTDGGPMARGLDHLQDLLARDIVEEVTSHGLLKAA